MPSALAPALSPAAHACAVSRGDLQHRFHALLQRHSEQASDDMRGVEEGLSVKLTRPPNPSADLVS